MRIIPVSESALLCSLLPPASLSKQQKLWAFAKVLRQQANIVDVVVGMNNVTVFTDFMLDFSPVIEQLEALWKHLPTESVTPRVVEIPVIYGGERGPDLQEVAAFHHTTPEHIIQQHSEPLYTVYMIGFQAGFPYLGGLPESLHTPRRAAPRTLVPAGSVGIGGAQTGVYPFGSPGGWQLIGHTELPLFDKHKSPPTLLQAGDQVKFVVAGVEI